MCYYARCVQLMYLELCISCGAECAGDAYVLVLAGDGRFCHEGHESKHGSPKGIIGQQGDPVVVLGFLMPWHISQILCIEGMNGVCVSRSQGGL
jgi:hypothetical protein